MFTHSHANTPLGQSERAYYLSYFIKVIDPSLHKRRKLLILSQEIEQLCNEHDPGVNEDILFHSIYNNKK